MTAMPSHTEIEFKFHVPDKGELLQLGTLLQRAGAVMIGSEKKDLHDVYFDTQDRTLAALGFGCRLRTDAHSTVVTLKSQGVIKHGMAVREEQEEALPHRLTQTVFPPSLDLPVLQRIRSMTGHAPMIELLSIKQQRTLYVAKYADTCMEASADDVILTAGEIVETSYHVEVELREGDRSQVEKLANSLRELTGWQPGTQSKLERGMDILANTLS